MRRRSDPLVAALQLSSSTSMPPTMPATQLSSRHGGKAAGASAPHGWLTFAIAARFTRILMLLLPVSAGST
jgi:hypothetical protein